MLKQVFSNRVEFFNFKKQLKESNDIIRIDLWKILVKKWKESKVVEFVQKIKKNLVVKFLNFLQDFESKW
jgi:hypothetical protein